MKFSLWWKGGISKLETYQSRTNLVSSEELGDEHFFEVEALSTEINLKTRAFEMNKPNHVFPDTFLEEMFVLAWLHIRVGSRGVRPTQRRAWILLLAFTAESLREVVVLQEREVLEFIETSDLILLLRFEELYDA